MKNNINKSGSVYSISKTVVVSRGLKFLEYYGSIFEYYGKMTTPPVIYKYVSIYYSIKYGIIYFSYKTDVASLDKISLKT